MSPERLATAEPPAHPEQSPPLAAVDALLHADRTLQAVIDAVSRLDLFDDLLPEVLRILMRAFGGVFSAYFEYADDGLVHPRWSCDAAGVYRQFAEVPGVHGLAPPHQQLLAVIATGFRLPPDYLGGPPERVVRPLVLSHRRGTAVPDFDAVALAMGWSDELLAPLVANGRAFGKLVVYRGSGVEFTPDDLTLAGTIAKHLSLVVQTHRLAEAMRRRTAEAAAAAERQRATDERVTELVRANDALRRMTDRLGGSEDITDFLSAALSEVCDASGAISAAVFVYDPADHTLRKLSFVWRGQPLDVAADPRLELWRPPVPADLTDCWGRMLGGRTPVWTDLDHPPEDQWTFATAWHLAMGHRLMAAFPLRVGGQPVGFLRLCFDTPLRPTQAKLEQCQTLAQQAALALQMSRTAARARTAAVAIECERAARERLGELVAANRILVNSLDGFTVNPNPDDFLAKVLMQLADVLAVPVVELWYARDLSGVVFPGPMYHAGRTLTPDESGHPMRHSGYRIPTSYHLIDAVDHRRHILWEPLSDHPQVPAGMWGWYRERFGVDKMINLPLVVGRKVIGAAIGFAPPGHAHTDSQLELGHALATQLALALQLGELGDRAKSVAVLNERARLARDIHDTLAQGFLGVLLHLETVRRTLTADSGRAERAVGQAYSLAQTCLNEARRSVGMLRVASADASDLVVALAGLVEEAAGGGDFPVLFDTALPACPVPPVVAEHVPRIAAEAVQNARRHARPRRVGVSLTRESGVVRVVVSDDGIGFRPEAVTGVGRYGLLGMRERAELAGCGLTVASAPGLGTTVSVVWPRPDHRGEAP